MSSFVLKVLACCFMVIDHIAKFLPGMPVWMHWIGRLASPLFIFMVCWSCEFTHDRKRYLLRLYTAGVVMSLVQAGFGVDNNVFTCLFQIALIAALLSAETTKRKAYGIAIYVTYQIVLSVILIVVANVGVPDEALYVIASASGSVIGLEGGLFYVILGVAIWATKRNAVALSASVIGLNALMMLALSPIGALIIAYLQSGALQVMGPSGVNLVNAVLNVLGISSFNVGGSLLTLNYQWMMIFALPFMLLYNRQRGPHVKWFFYVFYPTHIIVLRIIGLALGMTA